MKGAVLRGFVEWYEAHHGQDSTRLLAEGLPADLRRELDPDEPGVKLLASSWYPARLCHAILDTITGDLSEAQVERMAHEATRWFVGRGSTGIYRFMLRRLVTPEMYAFSVARLWRQWHTTGDRAVSITSPTTAESKVLRWGGHHRVLCTVTIETMCAVFETMGCRGVTWKRTACVSRGSKECVTLVEWTK